MAAPYSKTVDGQEHHLAVNHLGPFLFTSLIFNRLAAAGSESDPARIINVTSLAYTIAPIRFDDLDFGDGKEYNKWVAYGQSKTGNILFTNEIARRASDKHVPVVSYSLQPGSKRLDCLASSSYPDHPQINF